MNGSKNCKKCGEMKPQTEFYTASRNADGYETACKGCRRKQINLQVKERYALDAAHRERHRIYQNNRYATDPEFRQSRLDREARARAATLRN